VIQALLVAHGFLHSYAVFDKVTFHDRLGALMASRRGTAELNG
jgi:hypothetical protein